MERSTTQNRVGDGGEFVAFGVTSYTHSASRSKGFVARLAYSDHLRNILLSRNHQRRGRVIIVAIEIYKRFLVIERKTCLFVFEIDCVVGGNPH